MITTNEAAMTRRGMLASAGAGASAAALGGEPARAQTGARDTFVLVHGAWHGGWCWARVAERLRAAGHRVFTPTLTGLGDRAHLIGPNVGLGTFIEDLVSIIDMEDLSDVVLVGDHHKGEREPGGQRTGGTALLTGLSRTSLPTPPRLVRDVLPERFREMFMLATLGIETVGGLGADALAFTSPSRSLPLKCS